MRDWNLLAAWMGILLGAISGAGAGLFFHSPTFLGGYESWPRRMLRLGHIAWFGIAFLNIAFVLTLASMPGVRVWVGAGWALVAANFLMPLVCYLSAWRDRFRHLFFIPVICVLIGAGGVLFARVGL